MTISRHCRSGGLEALFFLSAQGRSGPCVFLPQALKPDKTIPFASPSIDPSFSTMSFLF